MEAGLRITCLVENTAGPRGLLGEHGLSFWVEVVDKKILFDTGQGFVLLSNVQRLNVPLAQADAIVLSHGHYDHTGGLTDALKLADQATLYAHREAFDQKYARNPDGTSRVIAMPDRQDIASRESARLVWIDGPIDIGAGFWLTGPVPRQTDYEDVGGPFYLDAECTQPDPITDDQSAFVETSEGTVVLLGCAHSGVVNTLTYIRSLTDQRPIRAVIGGTHLLHAGPERLEKTTAYLRELDIPQLLLCHCTGFAAAAHLAASFPGRCGPCPVGTVLEFS